MDCHNRPSHRFLAPSTALNLALSTGHIPTDLPYIRKVGLDVLNAKYSHRDEALAAISKGITDYYQQNYPDIASSRKTDLDNTIAALQQIYNDNFFPEMNTDYRARENNLSHFVNDGCFRCHDGNKTNQKGEVISHRCNTCHDIVRRGTIDRPLQARKQYRGIGIQAPRRHR